MCDFDFSVAMCVYGGDNAEHFDEALKSVFNQTLKPNEVVLVVDGPIPESIDLVISSYSKYSEFKVYRLPKNMGHGIARQESLKHCTNKYIAIADADDVNTSDRFELQINEFKKNPNLSVVSSNCFHFTDSIQNIINEEEMPVTDEEIKDKMKTRCPICQASAMMNKSDVEKVGGYIDWYFAEDYYLWIRLMINGAVFANVPKSLLYVRTSEAQMDRRGGYKYFKSLKDLYKLMLKNHLIGLETYLFNVSSRFVLQVILPSNIRGFIRKKFL